LNIRALSLAAALAVVFASTSMADIMGSTYHFSTSTTGSTAITTSGAGTYTAPSNAGFCVGPPTSCGSGSGMSGSYLFTDVNPTLSTITFSFSGSTFSNVNGSFSIDLGNFVLPDGDSISNVTYASGNLAGGSFTGVTWNGTDAVFTGTAGSGYNALGGKNVVFNVTEAAHVPEPSSVLLLFTVLGGFVTGVKKLRRS